MRRVTRCNVAHARPISQRASGPNGSNRTNRGTQKTRNRLPRLTPHNCAEMDSALVTGNNRNRTGTGTGLSEYHTQECGRNKAQAAALVSTCHALLTEAQAIYAAEPNAVRAAYVTACRAILADAQHTYRDASRIYADALIQLGALVALHGASSQLPQPRKHSIRRRTARTMQHQEHQYTRVAHYTCQGCGHEWTEPLDGNEGEEGDSTC